MLERNLPGILGAAIEVAAETGPPLPELLTGVLEQAVAEAQADLGHPGSDPALAVQPRGRWGRRRQSSGP